MNKPATGQLVGCLAGVWNLLVIYPIWIVLMFLILSSLSTFPIWGWVLFWIYLPATLLGVVLTTLGRILIEGGTDDGD